MKDQMIKLYVGGKIVIREKADAVVQCLSKKDDGSFLTENLGVVAITVALIAIVLTGMIAIIGTSGGTGVLATIQTRITNFFAGTAT